MTNKELSAALRDLDAQIDEFVREHVVAERGESDVSSSLRVTEVPERFHPQPENSRELPGINSADKSVEYFGHAPEPHDVGLFACGVYVLGATIFKCWPVIVRTLR